MGFPTFNWPGWRKEAKRGSRIRNIQTGATGTFVQPSPTRHNGAIVIWDATPDRRSNFVAIAVYGEPIPDDGTRQPRWQDAHRAKRDSPRK